MDEFEKRERRCPRLGGQVTFRYCNGCGEEGRPCFKTMDCWWEQFDVAAYLRRKLSPQDFECLLAAQPKPKVLSLVELIEQARTRTEK